MNKFIAITVCMVHAEYSNDAIQVTQLPYPIKAKPLGKFRYFQKVFFSGCFNTFQHLFVNRGKSGR